MGRWFKNLKVEPPNSGKIPDNPGGLTGLGARRLSESWEHMRVGGIYVTVTYTWPHRV